jgi:hypothetical protein
VAWLLAAVLCYAVAQPIPFSHKTHVGVGLQCKDCHTGPDPGERMTFPAASKCIACHRAMATIQQPIPWKRVYAVAAGVYWSHRTHSNAGLRCETCHGDVGQMEVMTKVKDTTSMTACMNCHRERRAGLGCELCHEGR